MGIAERRQRDRQSVRTKILDGARELFAAEGYDAVTMRRIAEAIEYSPTTIYLYFKDKDALIRELCRLDLNALAQAFHAIAGEPDPVERLRRIGKALVAFGTQQPNHYRLLFMSTHLIEEEDMEEMGHGNPEKDGYAFLLGTIREAIDQQRFHAHLRDAHLLAQAFWASVHGTVALHLSKSGDTWVEWRSLEETAEFIIESMIRGMQR